MNMFRAGLVLGSSVVIKMICGLLLIKVFTIYLTVEEFGQAGQYITLAGVLTTIAGGAQMHGLIKLLSARGDDPQVRQRILQSAHFVFYASTLVIIVILAVFAKSITELMVGRKDFVWLLVPVATGFVFAGFNNLQIATLSAGGHLRALALSQVVGVIAGTVCCAWLAATQGVTGAIAGFALLNMWNAMSSFYFTRANSLIAIADMIPRPSRELVSELLGYSSALVLAIFMMPTALMVGRNAIASTFGWHQVGHWQAILRLSDAVVQVFGTFFNNYMLPMLAKLEPGQPTRAFLKRVVPAVAIFAVLLFATIYLFRDLYVRILLTSEYLVIGEWLPYQFAGDVLRLCAAIGSYYFLARKMLVRYVGLEVIAALVFVGALMWFLGNNLEGAPVYAHLVTYGTIAALVAMNTLLVSFTRKPPTAES